MYSTTTCIFFVRGGWRQDSKSRDDNGEVGEGGIEKGGSAITMGVGNPRGEEVSVEP